MKLGKKHAHVPPLHAHFSQIETFQVIQGSLGVTIGYDQKDTILSPANTPFNIERWVPHTVWPDPETTAVIEEDTVALLWAHPDVENSMDHVFFEHLFRYLDECHVEKKMPDLVQMLVSQSVTFLLNSWRHDETNACKRRHATDSTLVILPGASFLGPLRWWLPWAIQSGISFVGKTLGYTPEMKKYMKDQ